MALGAERAMIGIRPGKSRVSRAVVEVVEMGMEMGSGRLETRLRRAGEGTARACVRARCKTERRAERHCVAWRLQEDA